MSSEVLKIGILVCSDRASKGKYKDLSGKAIEEYCKNTLTGEISFEYLLVHDSFSAIKKGIISLCDKAGCRLVVTSGGTGPAPRDVTPEATEAACSRMLPGFGEKMRLDSLQFVPTAILSRQTAGIRGEALVINLPGSPKAIKQCLDAVIDAVPDCLKLISGQEVKLKDRDSAIMH